MGDEFVTRVLRIFSDLDSHDILWWNSEPCFFVVCNDVFAWGSADLEEITPKNIGMLEKAIVDVRKVAPDEDWLWGPLLFCARVRGMRPQGAVYPSGDRGIIFASLFDECGPHRPANLMNPQATPPSRRIESWSEEMTSDIKGL